MSDTAASTVGQEPATQQTPQVNDTRKVERAVVPDPADERSMLATELAATAGDSSKLPWGLIGAALAAVAAVVVVVTVGILGDDGTRIEPIRSDTIVEAPPSAIGAPPPAIAPPPSAKVVRPPPTTAKTRPPPKRPAALNPLNARAYFRTGARLARRGKIQDATLMYHLAYAATPKKDPGVFLNLGIIHSEQKNNAKTRACFNAFLARKPTAPEAGQIRMTVSTLPPTKTVNCVSKADTKRALRRYARQGAKIESWVDQTRKRDLQ